MSEEKNDYIILFDYDSMLYKAIHKIVDIAKIREWFRKGKTRAWMESEIVNLSINRLSNMGDNILLEIEATGINVSMVEYFLTTCPNSIRKEKSPIYKANRKRSKWVGLVKKGILEMNFTKQDDIWEADDLIADRAKELGVDGCVICSMDKDLKQIPGVHYDYFRPQLRNKDGSFQTDERGFRKQAQHRGLSTVSESEAFEFFALQLLMGDAGDNIKGIHRVGKKKAEKILFFEEPEDYMNVILAEYQRYYMKKGIKELKEAGQYDTMPLDQMSDYLKQWDAEGKQDFELHLLLIGLGAEHRPSNDLKKF